jgi:uncharacterized protein YgiM (DUF1202 family)
MTTKRFIKLSLTISFIGIAMITSLNAANVDLYVQSKVAKLYSLPTFSSTVLLNIEKGQLVSEVERKSNWVKVNFENNTGWVSKYILSEKPPLSTESLLNGTSEDTGKHARKRASSANDVAATRGLREDQPQANNNSANTVDYNALDKVESVNISSEETQEFQESRPNE